MILKKNILFEAFFLKTIFRILQIKEKLILDILFKDNILFHNFLLKQQSIKFIYSQIFQIQIQVLILICYNISCNLLY